jgi:hypothetical protein
MLFATLSCVTLSFTVLMIMTVTSLNIHVHEYFTRDMQDCCFCGDGVVEDSLWHVTLYHWSNTMSHP